MTIIRWVIVRLKETSRQTLGNLLVFKDNNLIYNASTLELPWKQNARNSSCIPSGRYTVVKRHSIKFGNHFHFINVKDRDLILTHKGNFYTDTEGCVLVGKDFKDINGDGELDVTCSSKTMHKLLEVSPDKFTVDVVNTL